jgi:acetyl-CoA synthetase
MSESIEHMLVENRTFEPPAEFVAKATIRTRAEYDTLYRESIEHPEKFWATQAEELHWFKKWDKVLDASNAPFYKWFVGGKTNITYNCLDRHLDSWRKNKAAIIWEGEPGDQRILTYQELHRQVCHFANALKKLDVVEGSRVAIYMPMVPELVIATLACARIGAVHSVIFGGFSSNAIVDRVHDQQASMIITADGGWRRGQVVELKKAVDEALPKCPSVENVVVVQRTNTPVTMVAGRDHWWHEAMTWAKDDCPAAELDAEHPLYVLYTSGSTGKPKGILHTTAGYMLGTYLTAKYVFDLQEDDTYWCTADIGWVTGHSYIVYGILANGATCVMYEGAPNHPNPGRFWEIIDATRSAFSTPRRRRSARLQSGATSGPRGTSWTACGCWGQVGEPINPEAWMWYRKHIGHERCPIVDTWWQTETGAIMITTVPGAMQTKPGSAGLPFFGVEPAIVTEEGEEVPPGHAGLLVVKGPWPSMLRTLYGDDARYKEVYWSQYAKQGWYFTGDGAFCDKSGYYMIIGRIDDVINVSGIDSERWRSSPRWCRTNWWRRRPWSASRTTSRGRASARLCPCRRA